MRKEKEKRKKKKKERKEKRKEKRERKKKNKKTKTKTKKTKESKVSSNSKGEPQVVICFKNVCHLHLFNVKISMSCSEKHANNQNFVFSSRTLPYAFVEK